MTICPACEGEGVWGPCFACDATGRGEDGGECGLCDGTGYDVCEACDGTGEAEDGLGKEAAA